MRDADKILVPVLPSDIDIHACSRCIRDLLLVAKVRREDDRLGIIANRVRRNTLIYQSLTRFLETLDIPIVATLRDSQNYVRAAELGIGLHEMKSYVAREDLAQWQPLIEWLIRPRGAATAAPGAAAAGGATEASPSATEGGAVPPPASGPTESVAEALPAAAVANA